MTVEEILREVAQLSQPTRAFIAEKILEMLDADDQIELSPEWEAVIQQRIAEIDNGNAEMIKAEDVFRTLRSELE